MRDAQTDFPRETIQVRVRELPIPGRLPRGPELPCRQQRRENAMDRKVLQVPSCDLKRSTGLLCGKVCSDRAENRQKRRNRTFRPDPVPVT